MIIKKIKDYLKETNSHGVIKIYGDACLKNNDLYNYYILMERAERNLEKELIVSINNYQFSSEVDIWNILSQLIQTLAEMQKNHIVHRDIKPQNILIIEGLYKICDFGEALVFENSEDEGSMVQNVCGSKLYMSPVIFFALKNQFKKVMHNVYKSDVFSLGICILLAAILDYEILFRIRDEIDMGEIRNVVMHSLSGRYSYSFISFLLAMLEVDEVKRPDFIQLESLLFKIK